MPSLFSRTSFSNFPQVGIAAYLRLLLTFALLLAQAALPTNCRAEKPPKLSDARIAEVTLEGDVLADRGDYLGALRKYTTAYLAVVSNIRGQDFLLDVPPNIFNREQLGNEMLKLMHEEYSDEELALMDASYKVLGLVAPELDCVELMTKLLTEEVAGFYDPDSKRMVLIVEDGPKEQPSWLGRLLGEKAAFDKDEQKTTLAHELTHALQDQLYDLNAMEKGIEKDDDMLLAFSGLVEGDATLLMFLEMDGESDIKKMDPVAMRATFNIMSWMMPLAGGEAYRKAPPIFRDSLTFPYFQGMLFALAVAADGGWEGVHRTYADPPTSTEQILHPGKYLNTDDRDVPQLVTIPDLSEHVGEDWKHLGGNVLGELQTSILLKAVAGGRRAAEGWDGDRYEVFKHADGSLGLVFVSVWDSEQDAEEFENAFLSYRKPKPAVGPADPEPAGEELIDRTGTSTAPDIESNASSTLATADSLPSTNSLASTVSSASTVKRQGDKVWIVEGFDGSLTLKLFDQLKQTRFEPKIFPTPAKLTLTK